MTTPAVEAFGPYLVYEQLGAGGMASVHRAEVVSRDGFHRPVALKRMLPHVAANDDAVKAFVREAHLASRLRHANVAQTYELGKVGDTYFIAMELITGRTLREILRRCAATTGPMPVSVAMNLINQICDALDYAHNLCDESGHPLGIIHRDVSPSNVVVADGGIVKLIDFGIAKASAAGMQTMSGTIKGKFGYMAPEYIEGRIDARADLFAVGVIAHELLTNRPLFTTPDEMETLVRVRTMEIPPPSRKNPLVPAEVDEIVLTALARDPDRRWQHATALRNAMTTVTQRLGFTISSGQADEWLRWLFERATPHAPALPGTTIMLDDGPSIEIESSTSTRIDAGAESMPTLIAFGSARSMTAQSGGWTGESKLDSEGEYQAAVARFERHQALAPATGRMSDAVIPTGHGSMPPRSVPAHSIPPTSEPSSHETLHGTGPLRAVKPPVSARMAARPSSGHLAPDPQFVGSSAKLRLPAGDPPLPVPTSNSTLVAVVLVLLAAGVAALAVYFLLPLMT